MPKSTTTQRPIALYVPSLRGGGAERVMVTLANGFAALGHRIDLIAARADGPYLKEVAPGVRVVDLESRRVAGSLFPLIRYLRREQPRAMLSALNHANIVAILARMIARIPLRLVVSERNAPSRNLAGGGKMAIVRTLTRWFYSYADAIVCVSDGVRDEMERILKLPPAKLHRVYNPLDIPQIRELMSSPTDHEWFNDGLPVILSVGRLTAQKDYPTLLRAFALLTRGRDARLVILGKGEQEDRLRILANDLGIGDRVALMGFQSNPFSWMRACDLYVLSSQWEGLPGTLLQALACNARVVSTDCRTGPREILEGGRWGRLVPVGDAAALARAMEAALVDTSPREGVRRAEAFRTEHAIEGYARLLEI